VLPVGNDAMKLCLARAFLVLLPGYVADPNLATVEDHIDAYRAACEQYHAKEGRLEVERCEAAAAIIAPVTCTANGMVTTCH
jgi:hypothetical protein